MGGDRLREDARWKFGGPPAGNANYACTTSAGGRCWIRPRQLV